MREIATAGWTIGSEDPHGHGGVVVAPQPQLAPNSATYAAVVETFLACSDADAAWDAFLEATTKDFVRDQLLYRKYLRGSCLLLDATHIVELLRFAREDGVVFSTRMLSDLAKMHGRDHDQGIDVVLHQIPMLTQEDKHLLLQEMAASCASTQNTNGVQATISAMITQGLPRTTATDLAVLECCLLCEDVEQATRVLQDFQTSGLLLDSPVYASLIREIFFKCTRTKSTSRPAAGNGPPPPPTDSRRPALKMLHLRRGFVDRLAELQRDLEKDLADLITTKQEAHKSNEAAIVYWTQQASSAHAPMLFLQHFIEATATIVDKSHRAATTQVIQKAVQSTVDPVQFIVRAVCALPSLSLPFRGQSKIAKQLFSLVTFTLDEILPHHIAFCLDRLDGLSIHVVKELDDALNLVGHAGGLSRVLAFCETELLAPGNNTEKIVAFLLSRPVLCTGGSIAVLSPTLAQLFVGENDALVLQYFKPSSRSHQAITDAELNEARATFVREVIRLEEENMSGDSRHRPAMRCARRAIVEFKLEHEAAFLPLLLTHSTPFAPESESEFIATNTVAKTSSESDLFLELPLPLSNVIVVDDDDSLQFAYEVLMYEDKVTRIALDAEWRPTRTTGPHGKTAFTRCALLQIACDSHVFLLDLLALEMDDLEELLAFLLDNDAILKLGFRLDGDLQRLRLSYPDTTCFDADEVQHVLDLSTGHTGLSALVAQQLGRPLDKTQQCSDWEQRPLTKQQISYAALDAYCLLLLHDQHPQ
jgi:hypothetical protein